MRILELCAGYGGLGLGIRIARPDARVVGIVERQAYCVARWVEHVEAAAVEPVAIWPDLESFARDVAPTLRGCVDCITAGFPCQPFSVAGKRAGTSDARWIWPIIADIIRAIGPRIVFLENVAGLLADRGGFGAVLADLAGLGFNAEWELLSAAEAGANHFRFRLFILGHAADADQRESGQRCIAQGVGRRAREAEQTGLGGSAGDAADTANKRWEWSGRKPWGRWVGFADGGAEHAADADIPRPSIWEDECDDGHQEQPTTERTGCDAPDASERGRQARRGASGTGGQSSILSGRDAGPAAGGMDDGAAEELGESWWTPEPYAPEEWVSVGEPHRVEQLYALGNGVVPLQAALAFELLTRRARRDA